MYLKKSFKTISIILVITILTTCFSSFATISIAKTEKTDDNENVTTDVEQNADENKTNEDVTQTKDETSNTTNENNVVTETEKESLNDNTTSNEVSTESTDENKIRADGPTSNDLYTEYESPPEPQIPKIQGEYKPEDLDKTKDLMYIEIKEKGYIIHKTTTISEIESWYDGEHEVVTSSLFGGKAYSFYVGDKFDDYLYIETVENGTIFSYGSVGPTYKTNTYSFGDDYPYNSGNYGYFVTRK